MHLLRSNKFMHALGATLDVKQLIKLEHTFLFTKQTSLNRQTQARTTTNSTLQQVQPFEESWNIGVPKWNVHSSVRDDASRYLAEQPWCRQGAPTATTASTGSSSSTNFGVSPSTAAPVVSLFAFKRSFAALLRAWLYCSADVVVTCYRCIGARVWRRIGKKRHCKCKRNKLRKTRTTTETRTKLKQGSFCCFRQARRLASRSCACSTCNPATRGTRWNRQRASCSTTSPSCPRERRARPDETDTPRRGCLRRQKFSCSRCVDKTASKTQRLCRSWFTHTHTAQHSALICTLSVSHTAVWNE